MEIVDTDIREMLIGGQGRTHKALSEANPSK
jgi:hypothetical protein